MLSKDYRFHGHGSLNFVYRRGRAYKTDHLLIKLTNNPRRKQSRFAVVVSKKIYKSAVRRNRIRRRLYEVLRHKLPDIKNVFDIVINVRSAEIVNLSPPELVREINQAFKELNVD